MESIVIVFPTWDIEAAPVVVERPFAPVVVVPVATAIVISPDWYEPPVALTLVIVSCDEIVMSFDDWVTVVAPLARMLTSPDTNVPAPVPLNLVTVFVSTPVRVIVFPTCATETDPDAAIVTSPDWNVPPVPANLVTVFVST